MYGFDFRTAFFGLQLYFRYVLSLTLHAILETHVVHVYPEFFCFAVPGANTHATCSQPNSSY